MNVSPRNGFMPTVHTRIATLSDLNAVASLFDAYRQFYEQKPDLSLATEFIGHRIRNKDSVIILAETQGRGAIGFCQLYPSLCSVEAVAIYYLYDLYVLPEVRRTGTARKLLQAAEEHARLHACARLELKTARTNAAAQSLYESLGWVRDKVFYGYSKQTDG